MSGVSCVEDCLKRTRRITPVHLNGYAEVNESINIKDFWRYNNEYIFIQTSNAHIYK